MPVIPLANLGQQVVATASASRHETLTVGAAATVTMEPLRIQGLPRVQFWFNNLTAATNVFIDIQFSANDVDGVGGPLLEFFNIQPQFILPPTTPTLLQFDLAAKFIRVRATGDAVGSQLEVVMMAG